MWHPLHPQRTNYLTLKSKNKPLFVSPSHMTSHLSSTPPPPPLHSRPAPIDPSSYLLRYKVRSMSRPARRTSNSIFNNARSLLRHPLGPNSKTLSLCSCLFNMEHPLDGLHPEIPMSSVMD